MSEETTQQLLVTRVDLIVARVDRVISMVEESNARLQSVEERQDSLKAQLETLDARVEKRLQDTRPIWESVQSRLADLDKKVDGIGELRTEMDSRFTKLETDNQELRTEMASGFRATGRKIGVLMENLVGLTADIRELQDRIEKIESHPV